MMVKIILIGYMGSGKSTIARILSKNTNVATFDLDDVIEERSQKTIKEIFNTEGEIYFRKLESQVLASFITENQNYILSVGGGTPCYGSNLDLIKQQGITSVYLKASVSELYERLKSEKSKRPLLADKSDDELKEFIAKHLFERSFYYEQTNAVINVDNKTPQLIADEIKQLIF